MSGQGHNQSGIKAILQKETTLQIKLLAPLIHRVRKYKPGNSGKKPTPKFESVPNCQIADLSTILEIFFGDQSEGTVVEVGAYNGYDFSNSYGLITAGWRALLIEPIPEFAAACRTQFAQNPNVRVIEAAVGCSEGPVTIFRAGSLSTTKEDLLGLYRTLDWAKTSVQSVSPVTVPTFRLDRILDREDIDNIDILIVDVEGSESDVIDSLDIASRPPKMLIVEIHDMHPDYSWFRSTPGHLHLKLIAENYIPIWKDIINTVYVSKSLYGSLIGGDSV